jgi:uncharacterized membrane protein
MKVWTEKALTLFVFVLIAVVIGCMAVQKHITPATIDKATILYIADANGQLPFDIPRFWWTSLADAELANKLLDLKHIQLQTLFDRSKVDDNVWYAFLKDRGNVHIENAEAFRTEVFTSQGTIGAIILASLGIYAGKLGFSKPSDIQKIEQLKNGVKV